MPALIDYQRELCRRLYEHELPQIAGTNTSTTATTLTDLLGSLNYSDGDVNFYDGVYVQLINQTDDVDNGVGRVTRGGWAVTGSLTVDPSFSTTPASGDTYVLSRHPPRLLQDAINRLLRNNYQPSFFPLSLHVMGNDANDMEPSSIATDYTAENSGTLATESTIVHNGAQSLKVTAGAALSGASTGNISVYETKPYYAAVTCSVKQGDDADFRIVNVQNSDAQIDDNATTDEPSFTELIIPFTPPSGCEQVDVFMLGTANGDIAYFEDFQIWHNGSGVYPVPSWLEWPEQIIDIRGFPQGTGGPASDFDYRVNEKASVPLNWHLEREDRRANVPFRIWVESTSTRPYIYAHRPFAELSATEDTSNADLDSVVEDAAFLVLHPDRAEQYLSVLRQQRLGGAVIAAPQRVSVR
jgi:hypothetical protein